MDDLKERFAEADRMTGTDHWRDIADRAANPERPSHVLEWPPAPRRRAVAAVVAFGVFVAASLFAWNLSHPEVVPPPPADTPPPVDLAAELPAGWTELPPPPEVRSAAATAWTGSQLLVWGGYVFDGSGNKSPFDDGFVFDAASRTWSRMPPGPLSWRSDAAFAWTGEEFLIWGGWTGDCCDPSTMFLDDGAAYDPVARTWRELPPAPIRARAPFSVWTGEELIVWGSADRSVRYVDGAAYDPVAESWRRIADAPIELTDAAAVWTGEEMIVFGAALHGGNVPESETAIGVFYDPEEDTWRELPPSELSPQASTVAWTGREMVAWDYLNGTAAYDPVDDRWRELARVPIEDYECTPQSVSIPDRIFGNFCGQLVTFSTAEDRWREITRDDLEGWLIEPVAAGSAFLVLGHGFELSEVPGKEFDTRMLAYVPPSPSAP